MIPSEASDWIGALDGPQQIRALMGPLHLHPRPVTSLFSPEGVVWSVNMEQLKGVRAEQTLRKTSKTSALLRMTSCRRPQTVPSHWTCDGRVGNVATYLCVLAQVWLTVLVRMGANQSHERKETQEEEGEEEAAPADSSGSAAESKRWLNIKGTLHH